MNGFPNIKDVASLTGGEFETICRVNSSYAFLGNNTGLCRVLGNYKLFVDTRDTGIVPHLIMDGFWETWLTQSLAKHIHPGDVCIDAGANFGYFTLLMSALSGHTGTTIAVEPNPGIARLLGFSKNLHAFPFQVSQVALAGENGKLTLSIPENNYGDASTVDRFGDYKLKLEKIKVQAVTIDKLVKDLGLKRIDVIKMDVEGAENLLFKGMQQTIAANPELKIFMEYTPYLYSDTRDFTEYLFKNFAITRIKDVAEPQLLGENDIEILLNLKDHTDLFLTKK